MFNRQQVQVVLGSREFLVKFSLKSKNENKPLIIYHVEGSVDIMEFPDLGVYFFVPAEQSC